MADLTPSRIREAREVLATVRAEVSAEVKHMQDYPIGANAKPMSEHVALFASYVSVLASMIDEVLRHLDEEQQR